MDNLSMMELFKETLLRSGLVTPSNDEDEKIKEGGLSHEFMEQIEDAYQKLKKTFKIDSDILLNFVSAYYGYNRKLITKKTRVRHVIEFKHTFFYLCKYYKVDSIKSFSEKYNYNHATVIHAIKSIQNLYDTNKEYREKLNKIIEKIDNLIINN